MKIDDRKATQQQRSRVFWLRLKNPKVLRGALKLLGILVKILGPILFKEWLEEVLFHKDDDPH